MSTHATCRCTHSRSSGRRHANEGFFNPLITTSSCFPARRPTKERDGHALVGGYAKLNCTRAESDHTLYSSCNVTVKEFAAGQATNSCSLILKHLYVTRGANDRKIAEQDPDLL